MKKGFIKASKKGAGIAAVCMRWCELLVPSCRIACFATPAPASACRVLTRACRVGEQDCTKTCPTRRSPLQRP